MVEPLAQTGTDQVFGIYCLAASAVVAAPAAPFQRILIAGEKISSVTRLEGNFLPRETSARRKPSEAKARAMANPFPGRNLQV